jgi:hypothetical protein
VPLWFGSSNNGAALPGEGMALSGSTASSSAVARSTRGQVAAGQPGPVQGGSPGQRPGPVDPDAAGLPGQLSHEDLLVVDGPQCRRGASGGPPHGRGPAGGLASCHQDHLVSLLGVPAVRARRCGGDAAAGRAMDQLHTLTVRPGGRVALASDVLGNGSGLSLPGSLRSAAAAGGHPHVGRSP